MAAVGVLALSGCSTEGTSEEETTQSAETTTSEASNEFAAVGDTIPADCATGDCLGQLQVTEILVGQQCKVVDEFLGAPEVPAGKKLVQISGIQEATTEKTDPATGEPLRMMADWPETWDKDGFKTSADPMAGCVDPDGYEPWGSVSAKGEKMRVYGTFLIPQDNDVLGIGKSRFDLAKAESASPSSSAPSSTAAEESKEKTLLPQGGGNAPAVSPQSQPAVAEQAPVQASIAEQSPEPVIGYTEAPGQVAPQPMEKTIASCGDATMEIGTTFFTDGTSGWTQQCANQMS